MVAAVAARATAADTSIITHGSAGWARRGAGHRAKGVDDGREKGVRATKRGREKERKGTSDRERVREG